MKKFSVKLKRGMTLMEVVVSIFIITLISATTVTLIVSSVKNDKTNLRNTEIAITTETVVDCFRFSNSIDEMYSTLCQTDSEYLKDGDVITITKTSYSINIIADFNLNSLTITATDKDGNIISTLSYNKN